MLQTMLQITILIHSSARNSLKSAKSVVFFLLCILVDMQMRGAIAPFLPRPPGNTLLSNFQPFMKRGPFDSSLNTYTPASEISLVRMFVAYWSGPI